VLKSLREESYLAMFDPATPGAAMRRWVEELTTPPQSADLTVVELSQAMAHALFAIQPLSASEGLLIVAAATVESRLACAVIKLEREEGVRTEETTVGGATAVRLIIEENLIWTENTRVFKIGLFMTAGDGAYEILVSDVQTGKQGVADYWRAFLACTYLQTPDQQTLRFYEETIAWFNKHVTDPETRSDYVRALHTELSSNRKTFNARTFATAHLKGAHRTQLLDHLVSSGVSTAQTRKDTDRIRSSLQRLKVKLDGIDITADSTAADRVVITTLDDGTASVTATGALRRVSGSGY